jgi:hypothetical protein
MSTEEKKVKSTERKQTPTRVIVERCYVGGEKMETVFRRLADEQIKKHVKEMIGNSTI